MSLLAGLNAASRTESGGAADASVRTLVIEPGGKWKGFDLPELWAYRGLFFFLVWRDIKVRYSQTVLGAGWAVLQPVLTMAVFTVIFGTFAKIPSDGAPYAVFSLVALVPWTYFSAALSGASGSLVASTNLITKVYFPRLVVPLAPVLAALVDFAVGLLIVLAFVFGYGLTPSAMALLVVPVLIAVMILAAGGVGCWLAALHIQYRDVKYVVPFMVQIWMYASPVVYPVSMVPERYRGLYSLNPLVGVIDGFRAVLLGTGRVDWGMIGTALATSAILFVTGTLYFRRVESVFADVA